MYLFLAKSDLLKNIFTLVTFGGGLMATTLSDGSNYKRVFGCNSGSVCGDGADSFDIFHLGMYDPCRALLTCSWLCSNSSTDCRGFDIRFDTGKCDSLSLSIDGKLNGKFSGIYSEYKAEVALSNRVIAVLISNFFDMPKICGRVSPFAIIPDRTWRRTSESFKNWMDLTCARKEQELRGKLVKSYRHNHI
ncbi:hypothetical protein HELRODRAFT_175330 [Helobdella robusta]|uniref:Uncharacterized protein n=1 Tax=Helobdella robusta TaxID=6412 RepID=T1F953_HELRO|nr:hypothetical protein HELRODRAFT_175330 [Helobdella robusta]ESO00837.1 hypothetical protein HELRODRAFT_175330 [Helobdella robusta]